MGQILPHNPRRKVFITLALYMVTTKVEEGGATVVQREEPRADYRTLLLHNRLVWPFCLGMNLQVRIR